MPIISKSGRSKDVRRLYHAHLKRDPVKLPMKRWARMVIASQGGGDPQSDLVNDWLFNKE